MLEVVHTPVFTLQKSNMTRSIQDPCLKDAIAGTVAITAVSKLFGTHFGDITSQTILPISTIALTLGRSVGITCNHYGDTVNPTTKTGLQLVIAGVDCALLYISHVPLPLLSVSQGLLYFTRASWTK
jgi:hypothetical protein